MLLVRGSEKSINRRPSGTALVPARVSSAAGAVAGNIPLPSIVIVIIGIAIIFAIIIIGVVPRLHHAVHLQERLQSEIILQLQPPHTWTPLSAIAHAYTAHTLPPPPRHTPAPECASLRGAGTRWPPPRRAGR